MGVSYEKEMRKAAKDAERRLVTVDVPGCTFQGPVSKEESERVTAFLFDMLRRRTRRKCRGVPLAVQLDSISPPARTPLPTADVRAAPREGCGVNGQDLECVGCGHRLYGRDIASVCPDMNVGRYWCDEHDCYVCPDGVRGRSVTCEGSIGWCDDTTAKGTTG